MNRYLIRDDGTVFPFDAVFAVRKDMRPLSKSESKRYDECLKSEEKFVPDETVEFSPVLAMSEWALDLSNGELLGVAEVHDSASTIILTVDQARVVLEYKKEEGGETIDLDSMTNAEMIEYAKKTYNITIPVNSNKAEIRAMIDSAAFTTPTE